MKYVKTLDLWAGNIQDRLHSGELNLQVGQWLTCGPQEKKCRFISATKHSINVVHWQGSASATNALFTARLNKKQKTK